MGRLTRAVVSIGLAVLAGAVLAPDALGFDGFGETSADSTYAQEIRFEAQVTGSAPDRLELLITTPGSEAAFVAPVTPASGRATYMWDTSVDHVTPNTLITYRWRATDGDDVTLSEPATHRYEDDRDGLDWEQARMGEATVHWYGGAEATARRFGELTAQGVDRAEELLGTELAGPVDVFVYADHEEFFGALGPGAREWTGAAAFSELRTIFMSLEGGSAAYLEVAMLHEVTHIVFHDATDNPFHEPARWLNEGIATWSETSDAGGERPIVEFEAGGGGLFSFDAITEQFPIGDRGARLSYAQGTTMVDLIVDRYGADALARITDAYRDGSSDDEALEAGTGTDADELYMQFFEQFGVEVPQPISPEPIPPSDVERPPAGTVDAGPGPDPDQPEPAPNDPGQRAGPEATGDASPLPLVLLLTAAGAAVVVGAFAVTVARRRARRTDS
ncbi:MAG: peptidase MA family metallohydrolase [Candidatus Limnocylindria bacterium]